MQAGCNMSSSKPCTWWFKPSHADPELKILPQGVQESLLPTAFSDGQLYFAGGDSPNPPCPRPNVLSCNCNSPQHLAHDTISPMCVIMLPPPNVIMRLFGWRLHVLCWHAFLKAFDMLVCSCTCFDACSLKANTRTEAHFLAIPPQYLASTVLQSTPA